MLMLSKKILSIRLLILDVDGVLTDGIIYYLDNDLEMRGFHIQDGLGIKLLQKSGIKVAIISAKKSPAVLKRMNDLHIEHVYLGHEKKVSAYNELKAHLKLEDSQIAYMGDDLPDLPVLLKVGFAITVPNAPDVIQQKVDYITQKKGGHGAVREVSELILKTQNQYHNMLEYFV